MIVVWRLGGRAFAQLLCALCITTAPVLFGIFGIYSMNCFEVLLWTVVLALLVELTESGEARLWWLVGLALGVSIQFKHT